MEILRLEFRKFMKNNKGFAVIFTVLPIIFIISVLTSQVSNQYLEIYKDEYSKILCEYNLSGKVTDKSIQSLEKLKDKCEKAQLDFDNLFYKYQLGEISTSEYQSEISELSKITNLKSIIETTETQFDYAKENPDNRYILYTNGWNLLMSRDCDIVFLMLVLLVVTICFLGDTSSGMKSFILTCNLGRIKFLVVKLTVCETIIGFSYILHTLAYYFYIDKKYGLPNGDFPVQSLQMYSDYTDSASLNSASIKVTIVRFSALLVCTAFVFLCFTVFTSSVGAICVSSSFLLIPIMFYEIDLPFLPQEMCLYQLYDLSFLGSLLINIFLFVTSLVLSILLWKRKSNTI
ncbi:MAG: hypothetical protein LIO62_03505 [Clostridiales bacterium]|nr:hypothetical protein [Clostridiales bacterium]